MPGEQEKLFGTFERLSVQPTGGEKSTGLGLAIVKHIIGHHRGNLDIRSTPGEQTTFTVCLPIPQ